MIWILFVIFVMISFNALYVAAEFATVSARKSSVQQLAAEGNKTARALLSIIEDGQKLDRYVAACQIGITLSSILLGAFGQASLSLKITPLIAALGGLSVEAAFSITALVVLIGLTAFQMIFGELVPKSISLQYPTKVAMLTFVPMRWSIAVFSWFIVVLNGSGVALLKLFGVQQSAHRHIHSATELEYLIAESRDGGALEPDEHARLKKALVLSSRKAVEIMIPRPKMVALSIEATPHQIMQVVADSPYTRFPVYSGTTDNIIGMLHAKDFATNYIRGGRIPSIRDMLRPIPSIPHTVSVERLLTLLRKRKAHQAVVIDEFGAVDGIVTLEDVLREMMGTIGDEFKDGTTLPERLPDGRVRLHGDLRLHEIEAWVGIPWLGDAHTVSGIIVERLGAIPSPGERMTIDGVEVEVERVERNTVVSILAHPKRDAGDSLHV